MMAFCAADIKTDWRSTPGATCNHSLTFLWRKVFSYCTNILRINVSVNRKCIRCLVKYKFSTTKPFRCKQFKRFRITCNFLKNLIRLPTATLQLSTPTGFYRLSKNFNNERLPKCRCSLELFWSPYETCTDSWFEKTVYFDWTHQNILNKLWSNHSLPERCTYSGFGLQFSSKLTLSDLRVLSSTWQTFLWGPCPS